MSLCHVSPWVLRKRLHSGYGSGIYSDKQGSFPSLFREAGEKENMKGKHGPHLGKPRTQE